MATEELTGKTIAFLTANEGVEEVELTRPWQEVKKAGGTPHLIAPETGSVQAFNHLDKGQRFDVDLEVADAGAEDYDALVLPGGVANPDALRQDETAMSLIRDFFEAGKPVAAICHAPWVLIESGTIEGRKVTSWPSLETDIRNAGGNWVDEEVVVDQGLVTSRKPEDLDAFCAKTVEEIAEGKHAGQREKTATV